MSKVFSVTTLSIPGKEAVCETFIVPGIPRDDVDNDGAEIANPCEYGRNPDDFMYDHMYDAREIKVEYVAYLYGDGGIPESPSENELQALARIWHEDGEITEAFSQATEHLESGHFTMPNPFWVDDDDEGDE